MITLNDTILIGTSELRQNSSQLTDQLETKTIIITKRGKPIGVLEDFEQYQEKERLLEKFEDLVLGHIAKERFENSTEDDYISSDEVFRKIEKE